MKYVGSWATELEIQASADLLCVDIYTYSQLKWITFTANIEPISRKAIYLNHCNESHYEPIACVKEKTSLTCFSLTSFCEMTHKKSLVSPRKNCSDKVKDLRKKRTYALDPEYRQVTKLKTQQRYNCDELYQANRKTSSIKKYANNDPFKQQVINSGIEKYANNELYRGQLKNSSIKKYANNPAHRNLVKQRTVIKYREDPAYKPSVIERNCQKKLNLTLLKHNIDFVIELFQEEVKHGPEHVCCVCHVDMFQLQLQDTQW
jgi:hypothetical protein